MARHSPPGRPLWCGGDAGAGAPPGMHPSRHPGTLLGAETRPRDAVWARGSSALPQAGQLGFRALVGGFWGNSDLPPSSKLAKPPCFPHQGEGREGSRLVRTSPGFAVVATSALARCPRSRQGGKGQVLGAAAEPRCCQRGRDCPQQRKGAKPTRSPLPSLRRRQGLGARGCLWLPASAGSCGGAGQGVHGEGWACQMCVHSWGDGVPTPLSRSQPLSSYFNPKAGLLVPPQASPAHRRRGGGCSALGRLSRVDLSGFCTSASCIFFHQKREQAGPCWGLFFLPARCRLLHPPKAWSSREHLWTHQPVCQESSQRRGRVGVPAPSSPVFHLGFPRPSWQEGLRLR